MYLEWGAIYIEVFRVLFQEIKNYDYPIKMVELGKMTTWTSTVSFSIPLICNFFNVDILFLQILLNY